MCQRTPQIASRRRGRPVGTEPSRVRVVFVGESQPAWGGRVDGWMVGWRGWVGLTYCHGAGTEWGLNYDASKDADPSAHTTR